MGKSVVLVRDIDVSELEGQKVMIDFETGKYFLLKGAANDIWDCISNKEVMKVDDIVCLLRERYSVSEEECKDSVDVFLQSLHNYGFIEYQE